MMKIMSGPKVDSNHNLRHLPEPEPVPDYATYVAERELRLSLDVRCRDNYEKYLKSNRRLESVDYLPIKLDIENVSRCNFRCTMCQVSDWKKGKRAEDMPLEAFRALIDEQYGLVEIKLQGMGEPMIQGEDFFEMIRYARQRHIWVRTVTNASLLHLNDNYRKIIDSDVNELQVSIDGADEETFQGIRRGSVFSRVIDNCLKLNEYCNEQGLLRTKMWTVVQRSNVHQLFDLVKLAAALKFKTMVFSLNLGDWGQAEWRSRNDEVTVEDKLDSELFERLISAGDELGVKVAFWSVTSKYSTKSADRLCPWPFERAYISSDMRVVPCCMIGNPEIFEVGSTGQSFGKVWQSHDYATFRRMHLDGNVPDACRGCYEQG